MNTSAEGGKRVSSAHADHAPRPSDQHNTLKIGRGAHLEQQVPLLRVGVVELEDPVAGFANLDCLARLHLRARRRLDRLVARLERRALGQVLLVPLALHIKGAMRT